MNNSPDQYYEFEHTESDNTQESGSRHMATIPNCKGPHYAQDKSKAKAKSNAKPNLAQLNFNQDDQYYQYENNPGLDIDDGNYFDMVLERESLAQHRNPTLIKKLAYEDFETPRVVKNFFNRYRTLIVVIVLVSLIYFICVKYYKYDPLEKLEKLISSSIESTTDIFFPINLNNKNLVPVFRR